MPRRIRRGVLVTAIVPLLVVPALATPPERTLTMDPVDLIAGRQTPGKPDLATVHEGTEYRFATPENRATFQKDPARFEVADGGACGRMGPLSGLGDARRHAVHEGRIYFFASDGCREGFLKDPAAHIETDDPMPFGSHEQVLRGRATLDKVVAWAGGADRLRTVSTYRASASRTENQGGKEWAVTNETVIAFPQRYFQKEAWNDSWFSTVAGPDGGAMASQRGKDRIATSRLRAFNRTMARWPVVLLKAHVEGAPGADCPGLVVIGDGEGTLHGAPVEHVRVWLNGAASRLTVDKATGRLLQLCFRGREGSMRLGDSVRTYTNDATVDGLTLPTAYSVILDGKALPSAAAALDAFEVNIGPAADFFSVPAWEGLASP
ncbi:MAG: hypothetical protein WD749_10595 [Phycisphaerales bacterium]